MIGHTIAHYIITEKIGEGGMGEVYRATDKVLKRAVALKFLPESMARNETARRRFLREARSAAALDHPCICEIYEIGEADGVDYIVMECVSGETLQAKIDRGRLPVGEVLGIASEMAEALEAAQQKGIVHRDLKPANVMVRSDGRLKLMDFGLATRVPGLDETQRSLTNLTREGAVVGTVPYMSPEQLKGKTLDSRSDIFSFGIVLYEMLTGTHPFLRDSVMGTISAVLSDQARPLSDSLGPEKGPLGGQLQELLDRCLEKDRERRLSNVADLREALTALREGGENVGVAFSPGLESERHTVGRTSELAELDQGLRRALAGNSCLVCVAGEAGIGKTTLVEEFLDSLKGHRRVRIAKGQCSERLAGAEAFLPFLDMLTHLWDGGKDESMTQILREKAPWWFVQVAVPSTDDPANAALLADVRNASQERVKRELVSFLQESTRDRALFVLFEDLHWADVSSIDLLAYLGARFDQLRLFFVTTYRPEEMRLGNHPFLQIKPDLVSRGLCKELSLSFLTRKDIEDYLELEYPEHHFPSALAQVIFERTEGSPLFMADLLRDLQDRDVISENEGSWSLTQSVDELNLELPASVKAMIEKKIQKLGKEDTRFMEAASVQGFEFDSAALSQVLATDEEQAEDQLQSLERDHRFIQFVKEAEFPDHTLTLRYRFVHVLYQNQLFLSLTRTKRARLSRAVAETIEAFYGKSRHEVAAELAALHKEARDFAKAANYCDLAAQHAASLFAYQEAIIQATHGLELLEKLPASEERDLLEASLQSDLGRSLVAIKGWGDESVGKAYFRARELSQKLGTDRTNLSLADGLIIYFIVTVQIENTLEACDRVLEDHQEEEAEWLFMAHVGKGMAEQFLAEFESSTTSLRRGVELNEILPAQTELAFVNVVYCLGHLAWNMWILGFSDQALRWSAQAAVEAEKSRDPFNLAHYLAFAAFLNQSRGDEERVIELSEKNYALCEENAFEFNRTMAGMQRAWVEAKQGEPASGVAKIQEGLKFWRAIGMRVFVPYWYALIADILGQMNRPVEGLAHLAEAFDLVEETDHRMWEAELHRLKGEMLLLQGAPEAEIEACYQQALKTARSQEAKSFELRAAMSLSRLWQSRGEGHRSRDLLDDVYSWFTEGFDTRDLREARQLLADLSA